MSRVLIALGAASVLWSAGQLITALRMRSWPTASGRILASGVSDEYQGESVGKYSNHRVYVKRLTIRYAYSVAGQAYTGERLNQLARAASSPMAAVLRYPEGADVHVRYRPSDPAESVLEIGVPWLAAVLLPVGLGLMALGWRDLWRGDGPAGPSEWSTAEALGAAGQASARRGED